ncbi:MAG: YihY/virulence factor BrkB family protein [Rhizomicrobium sp.]
MASATDGIAGPHWWSICFAIGRRTLAEISDDRVPSVAAGITFFFLLALFPAVASVVSVYGLVSDRAALNQLLRGASSFLPGGAVTVLGAELHRLASQGPERLNLTFATSLAVAIWSASGGIKSLTEGLNVAYEIRETRNFLTLTLHAFLVTCAGIAFAAVLIELATILPIVMSRAPFYADLKQGITIVYWPAVFLACVLMLDILYKIGPDRHRGPWQWVSWGSAAASLLWIIGTVLFSWYVRNFGSYDREYGNLGAVVGFLTWIWLSLMIVLAGAELNCEIERHRSNRSGGPFVGK